MTQRVLILGGSGFVGRHVVERLQRQGVAMTVPTRRLAAARHLWSQPRVHVSVADVMDPPTLRRLVAEHDAVVNLIAILHGSQRQFERVHVELPRLIADAAAQAGGRRLVHISALGAAADGPSRYQRSKARGEAVLGQAAQIGTLDLTVLRPSVIFGAEDRVLNLFAGLQKAEAVVNALNDDATIGQTYECCGPEVWTLRELVTAAGQWAGVAGGRGRPVIGLPRALGRLQALALELLPGTPLMSRDNLDSMKLDNVCSGQAPGLQALGIDAAPLSAVGPLYLGQRGRQALLDRYRRGAGR